MKWLIQRAIWLAGLQLFPQLFDVMVKPLIDARDRYEKMKQTEELKVRSFRLVFLADRTNGRAYATVLRLSVCRRPSVCDVM